LGYTGNGTENGDASYKFVMDPSDGTFVLRSGTLGAVDFSISKSGTDIGTNLQYLRVSPSNFMGFNTLKNGTSLNDTYPYTVVRNGIVGSTDGILCCTADTAWTDSIYASVYVGSENKGSRD
jgi:hypothetical protein